MGLLIASMSLPAMFSMLIQALYNVVDSYHVAKISQNSFTALGYAFPVQTILMAFALGIGIGTNVLVARKLGERNPKTASEYAKTGLLMALIAGLMFFGLGFFAIRPFMNLMSDSEEIIEIGTTYLSICTVFSMFMVVEVVCNKILQAQGIMVIPMFTQLIGAITNIILDPIMIFGKFGFPAMGVKGAAIATVIGQAAAMLFVIIYMMTNKFEIHLGLKHFRIQRKEVSEIVRFGLPSFAINAIFSFVNTGLNSILRPFDSEETANAILATYYKLQSFAFMPVFGLNQGGLPILSYNFGANDQKRFRKAFWILIISAVTILTAALVIFQLYPVELLALFSPTEKMISIGIPALRIISLAFIPAAFGVILTMTFQSIGKGEAALIMSLLRQAIFLLPFSYILSKTGILQNIWFAFPISEILVAIIFIPLIFIMMKKAFLNRKPVSITE